MHKSMFPELEATINNIAARIQKPHMHNDSCNQSIRKNFGEREKDVGRWGNLNEVKQSDVRDKTEGGADTFLERDIMS